MRKFMTHDFIISKIYNICYVPAGSGARFHKNRPSHGLAFHLSGNKTYVFSDGTIVIVQPGDIIYLPKHSSYKVIREISGDCFAINFDIEENVDLRPFSFHTKNISEMKQLYTTALKSWNSKLGGYLAKCKSELFSIIYILQHQHHVEYTPTEKHKIIFRGINYIHNNYLETTINIEQLASLCEITPTYFRKIFNKIYGVSPIRYINILKIEHAKELLESRMCTISEAAFQSGYADISHFSREFKKFTGMTPREYVKSNSTID